MPTEIVNFHGPKRLQVTPSGHADVWLLTLLSVAACFGNIAIAMQFPSVTIALSISG